MSNEELRAQANRSSPYIKIAGGLWVTAAMIIMISAVVWVALAISAGDYFANSKAVRDAAEAGSGLLSQQGSIEAFKDWVLPFAFLGLATFMLGFGLAFADILKNVRLRGDTMAAALPLIKQQRNG